MPTPSLRLLAGAAAALALAALPTPARAQTAPAITEPAPAAAPPPAPAPAPEPTPHWYDRLTLAAFVDTYASLNANAPKPSSNLLRAYDGNTGFSLHWAGIDASLAAGPVGATIGLRFGPSAPIYAGADASVGLTYVKQAFATWKPLDKLTLDFGKCDQPFGSEVADSQLNPNYTRSALYWYAQPLFFTGLRADYAFSDGVDLKVFAVNGWNVSVDQNRGKSFGAQLTLKPFEGLLAAVGFLSGPEQPDTIRCGDGTTFDAATASCIPATTPTSSGTYVVSGADSRYRHLVDLVVDATVASGVRLLFNADYGTEQLVDGRETFYGANAVLGVTLSDVWSIALRGDAFRDQRGTMMGTGRRTTMIDGTFTVGAAPTKNLLFKLDLRLDHVTVDGAPEGVFPRGNGSLGPYQPTATLGIVATTN